MTDNAAVSVIVRFATDVEGPDRDRLLSGLGSAALAAQPGWDLAHRGPDDAGRRVRALLTLTADVTEIARQALGEAALVVSRFLRSVSGPQDAACAEVTDPSGRIWQVRATDSPTALGIVGNLPASDSGDIADEPLTWRGTHWSAAPADPPPSFPSVFVSYSHDSQRHKEDVRTLCSLLAKGNVAPVLDQFCTTERQDWSAWAIRQIKTADYILVIASEQCRIVGDTENAPGENRGLAWEMSLLRELCNADSAKWTRRILPVLLPGHSRAEIPLFLQPTTKDHYEVPSLSPEGVANLLSVLRKPAVD